MTIKYLVLSGGGPNAIKGLGALQHLEQKSYWNIADVEKIYGTSAGAVISVLLAMKFDWNAISDYIIKRPWHEAYPFQINQFFVAYTKKGLYDSDVFVTFFKPFFKARDISMNITMQEFYEYSKIELHFFTLEINQFVVEDISYKTHPDLSLLNAIHMSSALPIIISPVCLGDKCYMDGGVTTNYPLSYCLEQNPDVNEILGFRNQYERPENNIVDNESTILDYIINFVNKLIFNVDTEGRQISIPNEVIYKTASMSLSFIKSAISSQIIRQELFDSGIKAAEEFLLARSIISAELALELEVNAASLP